MTQKIPDERPFNNLSYENERQWRIAVLGLVFVVFILPLLVLVVIRLFNH